MYSARDFPLMIRLCGSLSALSLGFNEMDFARYGAYLYISSKVVHVFMGVRDVRTCTPVHICVVYQIVRGLCARSVNKSFAVNPLLEPIKLIFKDPINAALTPSEIDRPSL